MGLIQVCEFLNYTPGFLGVDFRGFLISPLVIPMQGFHVSLISFDFFFRWFN